MCGSVEHLRFACPERVAHIAECCSLVAARQRLLWARSRVTGAAADGAAAAAATAGPASEAAPAPEAEAPAASLALLPHSVWESVAAELAGSASQKVASKSLPDDPFFRSRPHQPGKRKHRQGAAQGPGGKQQQRTQAQKRAAALKNTGANTGAAAEEAVDKCVLMSDYTTPTPAAMMEMLIATWGAGSERLAAYCRCLSVPPDYTCVRVNTLQCPDVERAARELDAILAPLRASRLGAPPAGAEAATQWPVRRHELVPDVLLIPSSASAAAVQAATGGGGSGGDNALPAVVVDRLCGEAVLRGADVFAGGVISTSASIVAGSEVEVWCDLGSLVKQGCDIAHYVGQRVLVSRGVAQMSRVQMFRDKKGLAVEAKHRVHGDAPPMNGLLPEVLCQQNLPSAVVAHVLCEGIAERAKEGGEHIIDLCAAPGGKTAHIAALMANKGMLVAVDRSRRKMVQLSERMQTLGASCVVPLAIDSTKLVDHEAAAGGSAQDVVHRAAPREDEAQLLNIGGFPRCSFDRVLLDGPCSALGQRPRLTITQDTPELLDSYRIQQRRLARTAVSLLKVNGIMAYSTCTVAPDENECMIAGILRDHPCMRLVESLPRVGDVGLAGNGLDEVCETTGKLLRGLVQRFDPGHSVGGDSIGFFIARLVKVSEEGPRADAAVTAA